MLLIVSAQSSAEPVSSPPVVAISTIEEGMEYDVGDDVMFHIHVFEKGERVSADNITVNVGDRFREVNATATGTPGIYEVTFTINESDAWYERVDVSVMVEKGNVTTGNWFEIELADEVEDEIEVVMEPTSPTLLGPGDTISCELTVTVNGEFADYNETESEIWVAGPGYLVEDLNGTRLGLGRYSVSYQVPANITAFGTFYLRASLAVGNGSGYDYSTFIVMDIQVWIENVMLNDTSLTARLWVNNLEGDPVDDAVVEIGYDHDDEYETPEIERTGTTVNGSVEFEMPHDNMTSIWVWVKVKIGNRTYSTSLWITLDEEEEEDPIEPHPGIFDIAHYGFGYYPGSHEYEFIAYNDTDPWASDWVYYYFVLFGSPNHDILAYGKVKTDEEGRFSVEFTTPAGNYMVGCLFQAAVDDADFPEQSNDGRRYEAVSFTLYRSEEGQKSSSVKISTNGAITLGEANDIDVTIPGSSGELIVVIIPSDADVDAPDEIEDVLIWALIIPQRITLGPGSQTVALTLPTFLPTDQKLVFIAVSYGDDGSKFNLLILKVGQSGGTGDGGGDDDSNWFPGFEGVTVAAALGVALVAMRRKRR
jgi:hypothetical protein